VLVELTAREPRAILAIRNAGAEPVRIEVKAHLWGQGEDGRMQLSPTDEVVVFPPLATIGPGEERNLRVGTTARAGAEEKSFRIFLEELPPPERPGDRSQVRVLSRIGIPVFLAPERPESRAVVAGLALEKGRAAFALRNTGSVRVRPSQVRLAGLSADGTTLFSLDLEAWYVLAGGERRFEVSLPADGCAQVRAVAVEAALERDVLRARVEAPGGACAP
jgi:fimbrial chaperone protein